MRRKIIKQGNNALTLTLPRKWTQQQHLKAGDEVEIEQTGTDLKISSNSSSKEKIKEIQVQNNSKDLLRSVIASAYKSGYSTIMLHFKSNLPNLSNMYSIINTFTGLEIVDQKKSSITIQCFLKEEKEETKKLILKLFQTVHYATSIIQEDLKQKKIEELILLHKNTIHKLRDHALRAIHSTTFGEDRTYDFYDLVTILEKISSSHTHLLQHTKNTNKETQKLLTYFSKLYKVYLTLKYTSSHKVWLELKELRADILEEKKTKQKVHVHYYHILELYRHLSSRILSLSS